MDYFSNQMAEAPERVARGAEILDATHPGWRDRINPETLNIGCGCNCAIAQLYGDYTDSITVFMARYAPFEHPVMIGVMTVRFSDSDQTDRYYARLTECWKKILGHSVHPDQLNFLEAEESELFLDPDEACSFEALMPDLHQRTRTPELVDA